MCSCDQCEEISRMKSCGQRWSKPNRLHRDHHHWLQVGRRAGGCYSKWFKSPCTMMNRLYAHSCLCTEHHFSLRMGHFTQRTHWADRRWCWGEKRRMKEWKWANARREDDDWRRRGSTEKTVSRIITWFYTSEKKREDPGQMRANPTKMNHKWTCSLFKYK